MSAEDWGSYHYWSVSAEEMNSCKNSLSVTDYAALLKASKRDGGGFVVPREDIENAALAMPTKDALKFLTSVYLLDSLTAAKLLKAIGLVRQVNRWVKR